jgi:hypothetical protein
MTSLNPDNSKGVEGFQKELITQKELKPKLQFVGARTFR